MLAGAVVCSARAGVIASDNLPASIVECAILFRMRAITLDAADTQPAAHDDLPEPMPADNEVLVRVQASSVNPVDNSIAAGLLAGMGVEYEYPVTLGRDYAGTVEQTGASVSGFKTGDLVFG